MWHAESTSMCAQTYGRPPSFSFCGSVILVSYNNDKYCHNLFTNALFQVASHNFLRVVVYIAVNSNAIAALATLQTR